MLEFEKTVLPSVTLIMGLIMALLLGLAIRFGQIAQERTRQVEEVNEDLKREIVSREKAEEEKRAIEKVLMHSQKIQAIGTLAGGIAHDFNNILYSIIGYVNMAVEDATPGSRTHNNLQKVLEVSYRAKDLVGQILSFSRRQQYTFKTLSLSSVLESSLTLIRPSIPVSVDIETEFYSEKDTVLGNMIQLQQVFMNVIKNASDAMNGEGRLTIIISRVLGSKELINLHPKLNKSAYFIVQFSDTGVGMDKETCERVFEPFFTTKDVNKGTGLGMSIAHGIIQDHGGEILVESTVGVGTTFYIYLPENNDGEHTISGR
jgi:signal transduction histidine kinase